MTWQDELQNLDAELAAGRISAEEYRQRRDALLGRERGKDQAGAAQEEPTRTEEPVAGDEQTRTVQPVAGEEPTRTVEPIAGEEPTKQVTPTTGEEPTRTVEPIAGEEPTKQVTPTTGEEPTRTVEPIAGEEPTAQVEKPAQPDPFPPAFSWSDAAQQRTGAGEEPTQVVRPVQQPPAEGPHDATPPPAPQWGAPQAQWPQPQQQQQSWGPVETTGTPWGDGLPGSSDTGEAPWMRQGPKTFEGAGEPGKGKLIAGLSIGTVLLVAVIVAAVFFFTSRSGDRATGSSPAAPPPPAPAATSEQLPEPPPAKPAPGTTQQALVAVPGPPHPWAGRLDVPSLQGPKAGLLPQGLAGTALQNGLVEGWFNGTDKTAPKTTLIALKLPDQNATSTIVDKYLDNQRGLSEVKSLSYQGVPVVATGGTFRTAYVAHNYAIILDVSGGPAAKSAFKDLLAQQLQQTPPN